MCRLLFYVSKNNPKMRVKYLLNDAKHSLNKQTYLPPYLPGLDIYNANVSSRNPQRNMDGFGIFYVRSDGKEVYFRTKESLCDRRTYKMKKSLLNKFEDDRTNMMMAFIRNNNFQHKFMNSSMHCMPFKQDNYVFLHNGGFNNHLWKISRCVTNKYKRNRIDSQILFDLFMDFVPMNQKDTPKKISKNVKDLIKVLNRCRPDDFNISLNVIYSNLECDCHLAIRYRTGGELSPALYYNKSMHKGYIISSEPVNRQKGWKLLKNQMIIIKNDDFCLFDLP